MLQDMNVEVAVVNYLMNWDDSVAFVHLMEMWDSADCLHFDSVLEAGLFVVVRCDPLTVIDCSGVLP